MVTSTPVKKLDELMPLGRAETGEDGFTLLDPEGPTKIRSNA